MCASKNDVFGTARTSRGFANHVSFFAHTNPHIAFLGMEGGIGFEALAHGSRARFDGTNVVGHSSYTYLGHMCILRRLTIYL